MKKIVTIGGGTGQFPVLSGLKNLPYSITAIVTMADDGGSTGVLRDELGVLPPGDAKQCLVALSNSSLQMRELMNYRFESGSLEGHSFGNLLLSALEKINNSFVGGLDEATQILNVAGRVLPASEEDMHLCITLSDGSVLEGESHLDDNELVRTHGIASVALASPVRACEQATQAIEEADYIIIGPGDLYGSLLPNFLVSGIAQAVSNASATCVFIAPLTNKKGITDEYDIQKYVDQIESYIGKGRFDYVLVNSSVPDKEVLDFYEQKEGSNSLVLFNNSKQKQYKALVGDYLSAKKIVSQKSDKLGTARAFIRHDAEKLARALAYLIEHNGQDPFDIV